MPRFTIIKAEDAPRVKHGGHRCDCFCEHPGVVLAKPKQRKISLPVLAVVSKAQRKVPTKGVGAG